MEHQVISSDIIPYPNTDINTDINTNTNINTSVSVKPVTDTDADTITAPDPNTAAGGFRRGARGTRQPERGGTGRTPGMRRDADAR